MHSVSLPPGFHLDLITALLHATVGHQAAFNNCCICGSFSPVAERFGKAHIPQRVSVLALAGVSVTMEAKSKIPAGARMLFNKANERIKGLNQFKLTWGSHPFFSNFPFENWKKKSQNCNSCLHGWSASGIKGASLFLLKAAGKPELSCGTFPLFEVRIEVCGL